ncbi:putative PC-Esterase [Arabidopsis thaliana]
MNFIGDSVARNHMESLLCLLLMVRFFLEKILWHNSLSLCLKKSRFFALVSQEETPKDIYLMAKFLGAGLERTHANQTGTGIYYLDIDKIDEQWANDLPNTDIAIVSACHWLFRPIYIHRGDEEIGCIFCNLPVV